MGEKHPEEYTFKAVNTFTNRIEQFRCWETSTDIQIKVGSQLFPAHRIVLEGASSRFEKLLNSPASDNIYELADNSLDEQIFDAFLKFLYTGSVTITTENAFRYALAAKSLQLNELQTACERFLCERSLSNKSILDYFIRSIGQLPVLHRHYFRHIFSSKCCSALCRSPKLLSLSVDNLRMIIDENLVDEKNILIVENAFSFVMKWLHNDLSRAVSAPILLSNFPVESLSFTFVIEKIAGRENEKFVAEALYHSFNDRFRFVDSRSEKILKLILLDCYDDC